MAITRNPMRTMLLGASALAGSLALALAAPAAAQEKSYRLDIPPQPLSASLMAFGSTADQQIVFSESLVRGRTAPALQGDYTPSQALALLLDGTGLVARRTQDGIVMVQPEGAGPQGGSAEGGGAEVEALIVTAQKKEEAIQDVPIAISAFTQKTLDEQKIEGGFDLLKGVPNVTFSKNNFSGYNFSIRGIGTKAVSATTDPGVAVSFNNTTLIVNRLFEQEYVDVERVEVLRGPQGTLYGRNATSGVINVVSAKPRMGEFEAEAKAETGNYSAQRLRGFVNVPLGETVAVRVAGAWTKRDGFGLNLADGSDVDNRDLYTTRVTVGWEPNERFRANLLWEHFSEDDKRVRTSKQLCHHDAGLRNEDFESFEWREERFLTPFQQGDTSQGCLPGSLYDQGDLSIDPEESAGAAHGAFGTPNGASLPFISAFVWGSLFNGVFGYNPNYNRPEGAPCERIVSTPFINMIDVCQPDPYRARGQSRDLRTIHSLLEPKYQAKADVYELSFDFDLTDSLTFTSQTVFAKDEYYATQDYNRFTTSPIWQDSAAACGNIAVLSGGGPCNPGTLAGGFYAGLAPGGVVTDPQLGASSSLVMQDLSKAVSEQFNQEFRLASNFDGPVNFSLGANYTRFETLNDYYVFGNALTLLTYSGAFNFHSSRCVTLGLGCTYVDPNPLESINGEGHNYFRSANPYELNSTAMFGELYWQMTETLKLTAGLRATWDQKIFTPIPSQLLLRDYREFPSYVEGNGPETCLNPVDCFLAGNAPGGRGSPANPEIVQEWREPTGRLVVDWKPVTPFTNDTMIYASYSHGYKGGGANPPTIAPPAGYLMELAEGRVVPPTFEPEYIDAFEIGSKNTLLDGALTLNGSAFYYDYKGYQVSKIVNRSAANENFDATVWGVELESLFTPIRNLKFNVAIGYLQTKIADGEQSIDLMDRTQGGHLTFGDYDRWVIVKPWIVSSSNCVAPLVLVEAVLNSNDQPNKLCPAGGVSGLNYRTSPVPGTSVTYDPTTDAPNSGAGFFDDLGGNELPNAPHWTFSAGGQYTHELPGGWDATGRVDFYWQDKSFHRVHNTEYDRLKAWTNTNVSFWLEKREWGLMAEVYVKNLFDETPITDAFLNSDDSALTTNVFTLDPRLVGVSVRKSF